MTPKPYGKPGQYKRVEGKPANRSSTRSTGRPKRIRQEATEPPAVEVVNDEIVSGRHPVIEALKSGRSINKIIIAEGSEGGSLTEIIGKAKAKGIVIQTAPRTHLTNVAGDAHQGVMAMMAPHNYAELEDIVKRKTGQPPLIILLDEIADPHNLGAIIRTAEAVGAQGVIIPKRRAVPLTGVVSKAAAGALEYVPVARVTNLVQALEKLKLMGYWIVGTSLKAESSFASVDYTGKVAVVIGAEGKGLSRLVEERCDFLVQIPMYGKLQSLNASVAAGVLLYEVIRQRS